jgi:hypothetical protein
MRPQSAQSLPEDVEEYPHMLDYTFGRAQEFPVSAAKIFPANPQFPSSPSQISAIL